MRLNRLDLIAFGPFTDRSFDLSGGKEGFHLFFGKNEAGKSSALRAIVDLLFGIPVHTKDAHVHRMADLRIGAELVGRSGDQLTIQRRKGRLNTLVDDEGEVLDDQLLSGFLGGIERELFTTMFGFDHDRLLAGGRSLLEGGGDLGESLFGAGLGTAGVDRVLRQLDREADGLFRPRGAHPTINAAIRAWSDKDKGSKDLSLSEESWASADRELSSSTLARANLAKELELLKKTAERKKRLAAMLPRVARRELLLGRLAELRDVSDLPESAPEQRRAILAEIERLDRTLSDARAELSILEDRISSLSVPSDLLEHEQAITDLYDRLAEYRAAKVGIAEREQRRAPISREVSLLIAKLTELGVQQARERSRAIRPYRERLRALTDRRAPLAIDIKRAEQERGELSEDLHRLEAELTTLDEARDTSFLRAALRSAERDGDLEHQLQQIQSEVDHLSEDVRLQLVSIGLSKGSDLEREQLDMVFDSAEATFETVELSRIEGLRVPSIDTVRRFRDDEDQLGLELREVEARQRDAAARVASIARQLDLVSASGPVPSLEELSSARNERDTGWGFVRKAWLKKDKASAGAAMFKGELDLHEAYERANRRLDAVTDRLLSEADRVAKRERLSVELEDARKAQKDLSKRKKKLVDTREDLLKQFSELFEDTGVTPLGPKEMESWIFKHGRLVETLRVLRAAASRRANLRARIASHGDDLTRAVSDLSGPAIPFDPDKPSLGLAIETARAFLDQLEERERRRSQLIRERGEIEARVLRVDRQLEAHRSELSAIELDYTALLKDAGLREQLEPGEAETALVCLEDLSKAVSERERIEAELSGFEATREAFESDVRHIRARIEGCDRSEDDTDLVGSLFERLKRAVADRATLRQLLERSEKRTAEEKSATLLMDKRTAALQELMTRAGAEDLDSLERKEQLSAEKTEISRNLEALEDQLVEAGEGADLSEILAAVSTIDRDAIAGELAELERQIKQREGELSEIDQRLGRSRALLEGMSGRDDAASALMDAAFSASVVAQNVERFAVLKLASGILRRHVERYRTKHQGALLNRAGAILRALTSERYTGLLPSLEDPDKPALLIQRAQGGTVEVDGLSEGTRDQLYLALRLASVERHLLNESEEPLPLIVDDILVNFDDDRALSTLRVFSELAPRTQILFFTHHERLVELAKRALPEEQLFEHEL